MRKLGLFVIALLLLPGTVSAATLEVSGWMPYWKVASSTADARAHLDQLTEINPFVYTVTSEGKLKDLGKVGEEPWKSVIAEAKRKKVRVIPTVMWSDGPAIHRILSDTTKRIALEDEILKLVTDNGYDGIDIDFEAKLYETRDYYSTFLKGLQMRFPKKWVMCTIEARTPLTSRYLGTPPADASKYVNDYVAINKYCDRVRLMTYDQRRVDVALVKAVAGAPYAPVADVKWVEKTVTEALKAIPARKLSIGVATYGHEYTVLPNATTTTYTRRWSLNPEYALKLIAEQGLTPTRTLAGELSVTYTSTTTPGAYQLVTWSDAEAINDKIKLAKRLGLRGISIFKIDGGEDPGIWSLLPKVR